MRGIHHSGPRLTLGAILLAALALSGCASNVPKAEIEPEPVVTESPPEVAVEPPVTEADPPDPEPAVATPSVKIPTRPKLPPIAIVLSNGRPAYSDIAEELARRFKDVEIYDLESEDRAPFTVLRLINDSKSGTVVAIGLRAAKSSIAMSEKPVIFSQVFNYQDHNLLNKNSRGIAATTPLDAQITAWKKIDPAISRIGVIIGPGHEDLIADARFAAAQQGVKLWAQIANSDQETLYLFKRMIRKIDGFWLFPDNRILSERALRQMMADAQRQKVPVLVPSESMLKIGASISVSSVASDIAETIARVVRQIQAGHIRNVPMISPLSEVRVQVSDVLRVVDR